MSKLNHILKGQLGEFVVLRTASMPDLEDPDSTSGYISLVDNRVDVRLRSDRTPGEVTERSTSFPSALLGATESGPVLLLQLRQLATNRGYGDGTIPTKTYRCNAILADKRILEIKSTKVNAVSATFSGQRLSRWAELHTAEQDLQHNSSGRVEGIDIRYRTVEVVSKRFARFILEFGPAWSSSERSASGIELEIGALVRITCDPASEIDVPLEFLHRVQDLFSIVFRGFLRAADASVSMSWTGRHHHDAELWQSQLMPEASLVSVPMANERAIPLVTFSDLGGTDGIRRWIQLYDKYPRAMAVITNTVRRPRTSPDVHLLELAAATDYWVNSHKGTA